MVRVFAILLLLWSLPSPASERALGPWPVELAALKQKMVEGERLEVAARLVELYSGVDKKTQPQVLDWSRRLLEIFQTQSALNDFERGKSLAEKEPVLALELFNRALATEPSHPKILEEVILLHLQIKDVGKARQLILKMLEEYPLLRITHQLQLRLHVAESNTQALQDFATQAGPFAELKELAALLYRAHSTKELDGPPVSEDQIQRFGPWWPELAYLAARSADPIETHWAREFLSQCGYGSSTAAMPKYPTSICQRVPEVKELVNQGAGSE